MFLTNISETLRVNNLTIFRIENEIFRIVFSYEHEHAEGVLNLH